MTIENSKIEELRTLYQAASRDWEINPKSHLEIIQKGSDAIELRPLVFGAGTHIKSRHNVELAVAMFEALPDLLTAYEERDRLKAALVEIANYGRGEFPSLNNMADGFNAVQKIAEEVLEPKQ